MAAYTSGTAYVNHRDHDTGSHPRGLPREPRRARPRPVLGARRARSTARRWSRRGSRASPSTSATTDPEERTMSTPTTRTSRRTCRAPRRGRRRRMPRRRRRADGLHAARARGRRRRPTTSSPPQTGCAVGRHRLVLVGELRRAVLARLRLRVRLLRQPGARERLRVPAAAQPRLHADAGARGVLRAPDADDVGLHDPRRRDLPRRHPAHGRRRGRVDEPPPRPRGRLVVVLGVPERHLDRADRRPRGHRHRGIRRLAVQPRHGRLGRRHRVGGHPRRGGRRLRQLDRRRELHRAVQPRPSGSRGSASRSPATTTTGTSRCGPSRARSSSSS